MKIKAVFRNASYTNIYMKKKTPFSPGDRPNVPNVAIIVTDGQSGNPPLTASEAKKARDAGITILAIGVGSGARTSELNAMATDPDSTHVYKADNFDALTSLQALLSTKACEGK